VLLVEQARSFDPLIAYIRERFGIALNLISGFEDAKLTPEDIDALDGFINSLSTGRLIALEQAVSSMKSFCLAVSLMDMRISLEEAERCALMEEDYQITLNGKVEGSHDLELALLKINLSSALLFWQLYV